MTTDILRETVRECLDEVAPGAGTATLADDADLRTALDLDSMDLFDLLVVIAERTGVEIGDEEVPALTTVDALVARLATA